jgi:predicted hotdog family 3-hydroxylacyl-ACP dehydratase
MKPITDSDLLALIPQKPPFVMISELVNANEKKCTTKFKILDENVLCDNGILNPSGLIENIAQSCAAHKGYECIVQNQTVPVGFIGEVRDFTYSKLPKAGDIITTEITIENQIFDVTLISGKVFHDKTEIASCAMKIFVRKEGN